MMLHAVPVTHVTGVGLAKQKCLADLGIQTVHDLLHHFPFRYEDRRAKPLEMFDPQARVTVQAVVEGEARVRWQGKKSVCSVALRIDQRHRVTGVWFNQPYLKAKLSDGRLLTVSGKYDAERNTLVASLTEFGAVSNRIGHSEWEPVYRVVRGISASQLHTVVQQAWSQFGQQLEELLPHELVQKYRLCSHQQAVYSMHMPVGEDSLRQAHRRLAFEEFFLFQLQLQWFRAQRDQQQSGIARRIPSDSFGRYRESLPYPLTAAQENACQTITMDLSSASPMQRLLQGDVGSGKTWVAFWGAYATWASGAQSAFMAPTEILAEQHYREAVRRLQPLGMKVALLTGSTPDKQRRATLASVADGTVQLLVGTHALLTDDVAFSNLGLVITDEQHRFGVSQRSVLRAKGCQPDVLFLSATPIPRTLALAVYGDMDVSILNELPKGRKPIHTSWLTLAQEEQVIRAVRRELTAGRQAYVVAPLVEESDGMADVTSATELEARLRDQFAGFTVALLHGRMPAKDKDTVMQQFIRGEVHLLVSTTVIEVGIDVPRASVMAIYHAERFGLAQLHQLRGRVGRGTYNSYCILLSDAKNDVARQRLQTLVDTNDGFVIAEKDLELRGPGEFLGIRQSGLPEFSVGDLAKDFKVMEVARDEALSLVRNRDFWLLPPYEKLRNAIRKVPIGSYFKD
jgi:ATP-dependent DNA helicase RecG